MNRSYSYPNINLWEEHEWDIKVNKLTGLIEKIGELKEERRGVDDDHSFQMPWEDVKKLPGYQPRTNSYDSPEVIRYWKDRGMKYLSRMGNKIRHVYLMPESDTKIPVLVVYHKEEYEDPYWALKTLKLFEEYCNKAAQERFGIAFVVTDNEPDSRRTYYTLPAHLKRYHPDPDRLFLDLALIKKHGLKLKDIEFTYLDEEGKAVLDPDEREENFCGIPVLNIAHRTYEMFSLTYKSTTPYGMNNGMVDFEAIYHSEQGEHLMEGIRMEYANNSPDDEDAKKLFTELGLKLERFEYREEPWWAFVPKCVDDRSEQKLPLLTVPHFPLTGDLGADILIAASFYFQFVKIAAQGECILMFFPGNIADGKVDEIAYEIICEGMKKYPVDPGRVYIAGHSRQGFVSQYLAGKHPSFFAGLGILNDSPCIPSPEVSTEDIFVSDVEIAEMSRHDMPTVIVSGFCEDSSFFPINEAAGGVHHASMVLWGYGASADGRIAAWNRRLRSCRCREITKEEAFEAKKSKRKANRKIGVPSDMSETLFLDGHEHYIADFKNVDGNYHLRVVAEDNTPHLCTSSGLTLTWSFLRKFARDIKTGTVLHLK